MDNLDFDYMDFVVKSYEINEKYKSVVLNCLYRGMDRVCIFATNVQDTSTIEEEFDQIKGKPIFCVKIEKNKYTIKFKNSDKQLVLEADSFSKRYL